jgi:hypothetical protein
VARKEEEAEMAEEDTTEEKMAEEGTEEEMVEEGTEEEMVEEDTMEEETAEMMTEGDPDLDPEAVGVDDGLPATSPWKGPDHDHLTIFPERRDRLKGRGLPTEGIRHQKVRQEEMPRERGQQAGKDLGRDLEVEPRTIPEAALEATRVDGFVQTESFEQILNSRDLIEKIIIR